MTARGRRRRSSSAGALWRWFAIFAAIIAIVPRWVERKNPHNAELGVEKGPHNISRSFPVRLAVDTRRMRPVYRHSVIRGGVYTAGELRDALLADPVAAKHYANFRSGAAQVFATPQTQLLYASYRIGNNVYWTRHPLQIPAGEALISDGENLARARCGNRLSAKPQGPVTDSEPSEFDLDQQDPSDSSMESAFRDLPVQHSALAFDCFAPALLTLTDDVTAEEFVGAKEAQPLEKEIWQTMFPELERTWAMAWPSVISVPLPSSPVKTAHSGSPTVGVLMPISATISLPGRNGASLPPQPSGIYNHRSPAPDGPASTGLLPYDGQPQSALAVEPPEKFEPFSNVPGTPQTEDGGSTPLPEPWSESLVCLGLAVMLARKRFRL